MQFLGIDIGGANIKLATHDGVVRSLPFAMWKQHDQLAESLRLIAAEEFPDVSMVGLTMTAELADCFQNKAEGVRHVVESTVAAFPGKPVRVWMTSGEFAEPEDAVELSVLVAAANWHALASWAARATTDGPALLIDMGSTTTDLIPLLNGVPVAEGATDLQRLMHCELLYSGAARTPVCAVARAVLVAGKTVPLAAEFFATMLDVRLILGSIPEDHQNTNTADGRPATRVCALNRLAHIVCCDTVELGEEDIVHIARQLHQEQLNQLAGCLRNRLQYLNRVASETAGPVSAVAPVLLVSGSGREIVKEVAQTFDHTSFSSVMDLSQMWRTDISDCACAFAVARLVSERCLDDLLPIELF